MVKPDLSIIIPCHNLEDYLTPMLDSLNNQQIDSYKIELFFICDNCTDNTRGVLESYLPFQTHYSTIHIIDADCRQCGKSRNVGLARASGRYIMFLDGDDWLLSDEVFKICISKLDENLECDFLRFKFDYPSTFNYLERSPRAQMTTVWQYCFRSELVKELRFPSIQPDEDREFMTSVLNDSKKYYNINDVLYYYNFGRIGSNMQQFYATGRIEQ